MMNRIKAAWRAFRRPYLVYDGEALERMCYDLHCRDEGMLLTTGVYNGVVHPLFERIGHASWVKAVISRGKSNL